MVAYLAPTNIRAIILPFLFPTTWGASQPSHIQPKRSNKKGQNYFAHGQLTVLGTGQVRLCLRPNSGLCVMFFALFLSIFIFLFFCLSSHSGSLVQASKHCIVMSQAVAQANLSLFA